jgi:malonyl CoA-acyl carrier protein transacylase
MNRSTQGLATAARQRRERAESAVEKALKEARKTRTPVSMTSIAKAAGVSTDFIYRHPVLRPQVEALRRARRDVGPDDATHHADTEAAASTLVRRLTQQLATERRKHREEVTQLHAALAAAHGELLTLRRQISG